MLRWSLLLLVAAPSVASAQNLVALDVDAPPELVAGRSADFDVALISDGTTPAFSAQLLLVRDGQRAGAILLAPFGPITAPSGLRQDLTVTRTVPTNLAGTYQIAMLLDPTNAVTESNEFDNFVASDAYLTVRAPAPNAVAESVTPAANTARIGDALSVDVSLRNAGEIAGTIDVAVVLSRDDVIDPDDLEIGRTTANVAPGAAASPTVTAMIPPSLRAGTYRVGVVLDPDGALVEGRENDNTAIAPAPFTVTWDTLTLDTAVAPDPTLTIPYELFLASRGGDGDYTYTLASGALPDGLALSAAGRIAGSPTRTGPFTFEVQVASNGLTDSVTYSVDVHPTNAPLEIVQIDVLPAFKGLPYEQRLVVGGGEGPYTWTLTGGALPPGLTFDAAGVVSGVPDDIGVYGFDVLVEDFRGNMDEGRFEVEVIFASQVLVLSGDPTVVPFGEDVDVELAAIGGVPPYEWAALTAPPPGLSLSLDGRLTGTPTEVGEFKMRVRAEDSTNDPSTDSALITVLVEDDPAFAIVNGPLEPATVRARYEVVFETVGGVEPIEWRLAPGSVTPEGFFLEAGDGDAAPVGTLRLYGVAFREMDQPFILRVEDGAGRRREAVFVLSARATSGGGGSEGCRCTTDAPGSPAWLAAPLVLLFWLRRRRR